MLVAREFRRSTRVRLKVRVEALGVSEPLTCEVETVVVNLHGALILTAVALRVGMKIWIYVHLTDRRASDSSQLERLKRELDQTQVYHWSEVEAFAQVFYKPHAASHTPLLVFFSMGERNRMTRYSGQPDFAHQLSKARV